MYFGGEWVDEGIHCDYVEKSIGTPTLSKTASIGSQTAPAGASSARYVTLVADSYALKGRAATIMQRPVEVAPDVIFIDPAKVNPSELAAIFAIAGEHLNKPRTKLTMGFALTDFGWKKGAEALAGDRILSAAAVLRDLRKATKHPVYKHGDLQSIRVMIGGH